MTRAALRRQPEGVAVPKTASIGSVIKTVREEIGLSQATLAKRAGLAPSHISQLETDRRGQPSWQTIAAIAAALGVSLDTLAARCGLPFAAGSEGGETDARVSGEIAKAQKLTAALAAAHERVAAMVEPKKKRR